MPKSHSGQSQRKFINCLIKFKKIKSDRIIVWLALNLLSIGSVKCLLATLLASGHMTLRLYPGRQEKYPPTSISMLILSVMVPVTNTGLLDRHDNFSLQKSLVEN
jgi:hypothetical protein